MIPKYNFLRSLLPLFLAACIPAAAQLAPAPPDPLARIREAAQGNTQACSAIGESLCEQVAPKIIANAEGDSILAENLGSLMNEIAKQDAGTSAEERAVAWAVAAFRMAGVDVHTEKYASRNGGPADHENVVAEIRGREKPEEWVLVGTRFDSQTPGRHALVKNNCNAAMVIEAARDIFVTGIRPRRSIRFVLFTGDDQSNPGSWAHIRAHRAELDSGRAAILFETGCGRITGYSLNARQDIEPGVKEAMKPIESMGANHYNLRAPVRSVSFDFLLEGVPTLVDNRSQFSSQDESRLASEASGDVDIRELKRNTAIAAVTAFGIAERVEPIGRRQSRAEIDTLLRSTGLDEAMRNAGLWLLWESGERGRVP